MPMGTVILRCDRDDTQGHGEFDAYGNVSLPTGWSRVNCAITEDPLPAPEPPPEGRDKPAPPPPAPTYQAQGILCPACTDGFIAFMSEPASSGAFQKPPPRRLPGAPDPGTGSV